MDMDRTLRLRTMVAVNQRMAQGATRESISSLESNGGGDFNPADAEAVLERIVSQAKAQQDRKCANSKEFSAALATLQRCAPSALTKLVGSAGTPVKKLSPDEQTSLEAIIIADGSRPSFLLNDGAPPLQHPFMGTWQGKVSANESAIQRIAKAIGRIQPKNGSNGRFIGTGSLVDKDKGIILTNFHVLDDAPNFGVQYEKIGGGLVRFRDHLEIDFFGEAYSFNENRFRIVEAQFNQQKSGRGFGHLDAVTMRIEPIDALSHLPETAVRFSAAIPDYMKASGDDFCTIGFPAYPDIESSTDINWNFVIRNLFDNIFGVKRIAPGRIILDPNSNTQDSLRISFGHDASTFGGASGSPILAWAAEDKPAIGLHFAGATSVSNYAVAIAKAADELAMLGVPL